MAFAGLWDAWKDPANGRWLQSYTIVTTDANELMAPVHDRMLVISSREILTAGSTATPTQVHRAAAPANPGKHGRSVNALGTSTNRDEFGFLKKLSCSPRLSFIVAHHRTD